MKNRYFQDFDKKIISSNANKVLPVGFYDRIFEEAEMSRNLVNQGLDIILDRKFRLIETSVIEFEDEFSTLNCQDLDCFGLDFSRSDRQNKTSEKFFLMDPISGKKMVLRNDITLQIARLMSSRLQNMELPLRLCYAGDVFLPKTSELFVDRKQTQLGFEIIGDYGDDSYIETAETALKVLQKLGLKNLTIVVSLPDMIDNFLDALKKHQTKELKQAIIDKNLSKIHEFGGHDADLIIDILMKSDSEVILNPIFNHPKLAKDVAGAKKIAEFIAENFSDYSCYFDIFGDNLLNYHHEIAFDIFASGFNYPIARGGGYKIYCPKFQTCRESESKNSTSNLTGTEIKAVGATIYVNSLLRVIER